jgi:dTDP-4-dehydrorhamnose reductase
MKALVTGAGGQLGRALAASAPAGVELVALGRADLDLADIPAIRQCVASHRPDVVINAGAFTAVDKAETERELAFAVNGAAPGEFARSCHAHGARLIHVSTDYVFDGEGSVPYKPEDEPRPVNVYGASKLDGERRIAAVQGLRWLVVRTAWVYDAVGRNFLTTMLRLFRERPVVRVVSDQIGSPTSAASLARVLWRAASVPAEEAAVLHFTNAGVASWYDFAVAIHEEAMALGLIRTPVDVQPIASEQFPTPARRPAYGVLDKRATLERLSLAPIHWRAELRAVLQDVEMIK